MNKNDNPYNIPSSVNILSNKLIEVKNSNFSNSNLKFYFICSANMEEININFEPTDFIFIKFNNFSSAMNNIQCI